MSVSWWGKQAQSSKQVSHSTGVGMMQTRGKEKQKWGEKHFLKKNWSNLCQVRQVSWLHCSLLPGFLIDLTFCFSSVLDRRCSWTLWSITCLLTLALETSGQDVIPMGWSCSTMILRIFLHLRYLLGDITGLLTVSVPESWFVQIMLI